MWIVYSRISLRFCIDVQMLTNSMVVYRRRFHGERKQKQTLLRRRSVRGRRNWKSETQRRLLSASGCRPWRLPGGHLTILHTYIWYTHIYIIRTHLFTYTLSQRQKLPSGHFLSHIHMYIIRTYVSFNCALHVSVYESFFYACVYMCMYNCMYYTDRHNRMNTYTHT